MSKCLVLLCVALFLQGCVSGFKIHTLNDKFSSPNKNISVITSGNKFSNKSITGKFIGFSMGIYLNPFVIKDNSSFKPISVGFTLSNWVSEKAETFSSMCKIIFLADGKRIEVILDPSVTIHKQGTESLLIGKYGERFHEVSTGCLSFDDFRLISQSLFLEAKIVGKKRSKTYLNKEVLPSFLVNLNKFYEQEVENYNY
ncbi:MAG: hypothetical protein COA79_13915 [Planctomycetota bacterium]|nr:MAG: hypothetical protein COA79_13915 [Planctomycetota bacterium]